MAEDRKVITSIYIPRSMDMELEEKAAQYETSKCAITRMCLKSGLSKL